jgi:hypothetical protein
MINRAPHRHDQVKQQAHGTTQARACRSRERLVYLDSLEAELARRDAEAERHLSPVRRRGRADRVAAELAELRVRVACLRGGRAPTNSADVTGLRWTRNNSTPLPISFGRQRKKGRRTPVAQEATAKLNVALLEMGAATEQVRRADHLRSEVIGTLLAPRDVGDG